MTAIGQPVFAKPFEARLLLKAAEGASLDGPGDWDVYGPVHGVDEEDYDGDILTKGGVLRGLQTHQRLNGNVDYAHMYKQTARPMWLVGRAQPDVPEINGVPNLVTRLFKKKPVAREVMEHLLADGVMGYSLQGVATAVDPHNAKRVTGLDIHLVTIDPAPKSFDKTRLTIGRPQSLGALSKSLSEEIVQGDMRGWTAIGPDMLTGDDVLLWDASGVVHPYAWLDKAITVGDGAVMPGDTGGRAARAELVMGNVGGRREKPKDAKSGQDKPEQSRCPYCETKNRSWRKECRNCGCHLSHFRD